MGSCLRRDDRGRSSDDLHRHRHPLRRLVPREHREHRPGRVRDHLDHVRNQVHSALYRGRQDPDQPERAPYGGPEEVEWADR